MKHIKSIAGCAALLAALGFATAGQAQTDHPPHFFSHHKAHFFSHHPPHFFSHHKAHFFAHNGPPPEDEYTHHRVSYHRSDR